MATLASQVAVVTVMDGRRLHGTTGSAFASLALLPSMVLASLDERSWLLAIIRRTGHFGLNILGAHQAHLATAFARSEAGKFDAVGRYRAMICHACLTRQHGSPPRSTTTSLPSLSVCGETPGMPGYPSWARQEPHPR